MDEITDLDAALDAVPDADAGEVAEKLRAIADLDDEMTDARACLLACSALLDNRTRPDATTAEQRAGK